MSAGQDFDPNRCIIPEASERLSTAQQEIEKRLSEVDTLSAEIAERETRIHTHLMHIAALRSAARVYDDVLTHSQPKPVAYEQTTASTPIR